MGPRFFAFALVHRMHRLSPISPGPEPPLLGGVLVGDSDGHHYAGFAADGDDGDDLMFALARKIVAGEEDPGSVESVFEQARQVAAEAEALLVDDGWHAPEPESVAAGAPVATASVAAAVEPERQSDAVLVGGVHGGRARRGARSRA